MSEQPDLYAELDPKTRDHTHSIKWTEWSAYGPDLIPLWIADMDFPIAPPIARALHTQLDQSLGYPPNDQSALTQAILSSLTAQGLSDLSPNGLHYFNGVVPGLYAAVRGLSAPGDAVLTMTPIYPPFHQAIIRQERRVLAVPLRANQTGDQIDWPALEAAAKQAELLMLCHPHNPTGRVWNAEELQRLRDLVLKHELYVLSDEIHADIRFTGQLFESFAADQRVRDRTITLTGPAKSYNTAGLGIGVALSHNEALLAQVIKPVEGLMGHPCALSFTAWAVALAEAQPWFSDTLAYLKGNRDFLAQFLQEHLPWINYLPGEATYLAWLDLRAHPQAAQIHRFLLQEAKVALNDGPAFAPDELKPQYQGFVRLNFATTRRLLHEALERMRVALAF